MKRSEAHPLNKNNRGMALVYAIMMMLVLSAGSAVLWRQLHLHIRCTQMREFQVEAYTLAEAGLEEALARLRFDSEAPPASWEGRLPEGRYQVEIRKLPATMLGATCYTLHAVGLAQSGIVVQGRYALSARLILDQNKAIRLWEIHKDNGLVEVKEAS